MPLADRWGALVQEVSPGLFRASLNGFTGEGSSALQAVAELCGAIAGTHTDGPADPVWHRRYQLAHAADDADRYAVMRDAIAALRPNQQWEGISRNAALAVVDDKMQRLQGRVQALRAEDEA